MKIITQKLTQHIVVHFCSLKNIYSVSKKILDIGKIKVDWQENLNNIKLTTSGF
jgi:hypothetical protein